MRGALAIAALALCVAVPEARAHHSLAPYIRTRADVLVGKVMEFAWTNPHTKLVISARNADGTFTEWTFEGVSVSRLASAGFKKDTLMPGDTIVVAYNPRRDNTPGGMFVAVTLSNGKTLKLDRYQLLQGGGQRLE